MSYDTLLYVWDAFTFIFFIVIFLSSFNEKKYFDSNRRLIITSVLLFTGMFLFYREQYILSKGNQSPIITFLTYSFSATAHMMLASLIVSLYTKVVLNKIVLRIIVGYGFVVGGFMVVNLYFGNVISTHILLGFINSIPLTHIFVYVIKNDKKYYKNVFVIQILSLLLIYIIKSFNLIISYDHEAMTYNTYHDIGLLMVANVIIFSMILSYLITKNNLINQELESHKFMIEASLTKAIDLSERDILTNSYNRRKIYDVMDKLLGYEHYQHQVFSVIMIDVNGFKEVNDTFGHQVGDEILIFISQSISKLLRDGDYLSRWGGDEFLILLPNTNNQQAVSVINKIRHYFDNNSFSKTNTTMSLSFGVSDSTMSDNVDDIIHIADRRMYIEKSAYKKD